MTNKEMITVPEKRNMIFHILSDQHSYSPAHWHEALEIIYVLEGSAIVTVFDKSITLNPGQFILLNSGLVHSSQCPEENRTILMQIPDDFLASHLPDITKLWFSIDFNSNEPNTQKFIHQMKTILLTMKELQEAELPGYSLRFHQYLFEFLDILYSNFCQEIPGTYQPKSSLTLSRLDLVINYTQQHYTAPISLKEIAAVASLQPEYFCRFFRQNMGMTYLQYLNDFRLSKIYRDLVTSDLSVHELAEKHGFANEKMFHRLFRERFQTTPLKMRKSIQTI